MLFSQYNYALFFNLLRRDNQIISTPIAPTITDIGNQCSFIVSPALGKDTLPSAFNNPPTIHYLYQVLTSFLALVWVYLEYCLINLILDSLNLLTYLNPLFSHFYSIDLVNLDDLLLVIKYSLYLFRLIESLL